MTAFRVSVIYLLLAAYPVFGLEVPNVDPKVLDMLLDNKQFEKFAKLMNIPDVSLVIPKERSGDESPMLHKELRFGDILLAEENEESARQGLRFDKNPDKKWPNGRIPYVIHKDYNRDHETTIRNAINRWNEQVDCIKFTPRQRETNYVEIFSGNGCYSYLGMNGGQQVISLDSRSCLRQGIILHEFMHVIGFSHEHMRYDRDKYVQVLWENIPDDGIRTYGILDPKEFGVQGEYDYYSLMHAPYNVLGSDKPAFRILTDGIDTNRMGKGHDLTEKDLEKIRLQYC